MRNKLTIVKTNISDNNDYSFIYDTAIHNTLGPYWQWAKENNVNVSFEKHTDQDVATWSLRLAVTAEFSSATDLALFKLSFGNFPLTKLNQESLENAHYF